MPLNDEQQAALERLRENPALTDNLTDEPAKALLAWAEEQIGSGRPASEVSAAMRAANRSGAQTSAAVLAAAQAALPQPAAAGQPGPGATERHASTDQPGAAYAEHYGRKAGQQAAGATAVRPPSRWSRLRRWLFGPRRSKH